MRIIGSLVVGSAHQTNMALPALGQGESGSHILGRYSGLWSVHWSSEVTRREVLLPQRDHQMAVYDASSVPDYVPRRLATLDSEYQGSTQRVKLRSVMAENSDWSGLSVINTTSTHGSLALLASGETPWVWSEFSIEPSMQHSWFTQMFRVRT